MVGGNSLAPHYKWMWMEAYLNSGFLSMHLQHTRMLAHLTSSGWAERGVVRQGNRHVLTTGV
jgi:hypothetical protein